MQFRVRGAPSGRITGLSLWVTESRLVLPEIIKLLLIKNIQTDSPWRGKEYQERNGKISLKKLNTSHWEVAAGPHSIEQKAKSMAGEQQELLRRLCP
jgi:hypothetical protein